eukprot:scaffold89573_cov72-Phaeocystis_antarctica.AAC.1
MRTVRVTRRTRPRRPAHRPGALEHIHDHKQPYAILYTVTTHSVPSPYAPEERSRLRRAGSHWRLPSVSRPQRSGARHARSDHAHRVVVPDARDVDAVEAQEVVGLLARLAVHGARVVPQHIDHGGLGQVGPAGKEAQRPNCAGWGLGMSEGTREGGGDTKGPGARLRRARRQRRRPPRRRGARHGRGRAAARSPVGGGGTGAVIVVE